jgi:hypothetical protein
MFILFPVVGAVVLVFFGYVALWSAYGANIPKGVAQFGRILSIVLFVFAGLVLLSGVAMRCHRFGSHMMGGMRPGMSFMKGQMPCGMDQGKCCDMKGMDRAAPAADVKTPQNVPEHK